MSSNITVKDLKQEGKKTYHCIVIKLLVIFCQSEQSHGYKHCSRQTIILLLKKKNLYKQISCSESILILNKSFEASLEVKGIIA